jgi:putative membrane protein insertion efficiency factor
MMQRLLITVVKAYRLVLSPWLGSACRFQPTCSYYAIEALTRHGAASGTHLTFKRLARCHPWCDGGHDPVPELFKQSWFFETKTLHPTEPPST